VVVALSPPSVNSIQLTNDIVRERTHEPNKTAFRSFCAEWKQRNHEYLTVFGDPEQINPSSPAAISLRDALVNLYNTAFEGSAHAIELAKLRDHDLCICPACGEIGRPKTLDHYLPKGSFPEFALFPPNLFPMCGDCQIKKGSRVLNAESRRLYIHPYFMRFSGAALLSLKIFPPYEAPSDFRLSAHPSLTAAEQEQLSQHSGGLDIHARFSVYFRSAYKRLHKNVRNARDTDQNVQSLLNVFRYNTSLTSVNCWDYLLYDEALGNEPLCDYLTSGRLPEYS